MGELAKDLPDAGPELPGPDGRPGGAEAARAGRLSVGLTVREVLGVPALAGARVLAGESGLGRTVSRLNVMEVPDILPWVKAHELLLTTGYPLRHSPGELADLMDRLDERDLAAVAIKLHRYLDALPAEVLDRADRLGLPVIQIPDTVAFDEILNQVLTGILDHQAAVLARSEEVHRALVTIVLAGGGLQEVSDELVRLMGGVVAVTDTRGRVLAASGAHDPLALLRDRGHLTADGRFVTGGDGRAGDLAVVPVVAGSLDHGRIVALSPERPHDQTAVHTLERAATVAALLVTKELAVNAVESKYRADFVRDVLDGRAGGPDRVVAHAGSLGWDLARPLVVVVSELDGDEPSSRPPTRTGSLAEGPDRFASAWAAAIRKRDPHAAVVGLSHEVVVLLGAPAERDPHRLVREAAAQVAASTGSRTFSTGLSRAVPGLEAVPEAYEQARRSVAVGRHVHGRGAVARFDDLGLYRLLSLVTDAGELRTFVDETLGPLAARDDPEAADLRRTLQVLLDTNLNVAETSRRLHFHYNTLRYRIGKLERLVGPFTTDPHLRLDLMVALRAHQMRGL